MYNTESIEQNQLNHDTPATNYLQVAIWAISLTAHFNHLRKVEPTLENGWMVQIIWNTWTQQNVRLFTWEVFKIQHSAENIS